MTAEAKKALEAATIKYKDLQVGHRMQCAHYTIHVMTEGLSVDISVGPHFDCQVEAEGKASMLSSRIGELAAREAGRETLRQQLVQQV